MNYFEIRNCFREMIQENSPYAVHLFQWVDYHTTAYKHRLKMDHDILLKGTGEVLFNAYPNANSWSVGNRTINDSEVQAIRISKRLMHNDHEWKHPANKSE